jgi:hypothetical protein
MSTEETSSNSDNNDVNESIKKVKNISSFHLFFKQLWVMIKRNAILQVSENILYQI